MYISHRAALVRNLGVAICNDAITLIILLIAPLGLTAVIINTILVVLASFVNAAAGDSIVRFLQPAQIKTIIAEIINQNSIIINSSQQKQK
jgi:hypothetical protein